MPKCRSPPFLFEKQKDKREMEETLWQVCTTCGFSEEWIDLDYMVNLKRNMMKFN